MPLEPTEGEDLDLKAIGDEIDGADPAATEEVTEEAAVDPAADEPTQAQDDTKEKAPSTEIEVAGRKYPDLDAFKRSHDHLYRHASRLEQELAKERKWGGQYRELEKVWKQDPELFNALKKAEDEYFKARGNGSTVTQAKAKSGLTGVPPEVMKELRELRQQLNEQRERNSAEDITKLEQSLNAELSQFRAAHKEVDDAVTDSVRGIMLEYAEKRHEELSFEQGYETYLIRQNRVAKTELERVRAQGNTSSPTGTSPKAPAKDRAKMTESELDAEILESLKGLPD